MSSLISSVCSGCNLGSPSSWTCLKKISKGRHPGGSRSDARTSWTGPVPLERVVTLLWAPSGCLSFFLLYFFFHSFCFYPKFVSVDQVVNLHHNCPVKYLHHCWHCTNLPVNLTIHVTLTCEQDSEIPKLLHLGQQLTPNQEKAIVFWQRATISDLTHPECFTHLAAGAWGDRLKRSTEPHHLQRNTFFRSSNLTLSSPKCILILITPDWLPEWLTNVFVDNQMYSGRSEMLRNMNKLSLRFWLQRRVNTTYKTMSRQGFTAPVLLLHPGALIYYYSGTSPGTNLPLETFLEAAPTFICESTRVVSQRHGL